MNRHRELIFRNSPNYILIWAVLMIIFIASFLFIGIFYKYNKFTTFSGLVRQEGSDIFVQIFVPYTYMGIIKDDNLIIDSVEQDYTYVVADDIYTENNTIYKSVLLKTSNRYEIGEIVNVTFKSNKTTFVKEIKKKWKKGMM